MAAKEDSSDKKVFVCYPNDPDPNNGSHEFALYKTNVFLQTVDLFIKCLGQQPGISVICRTKFSDEEIDHAGISEFIKQSDCILIICCPALVYLLSTSVRSYDKLQENQIMIELRTILGQLLVDNKNRLIPIFLNTHSNNIGNNMPPEMLVNANPVRVCVATSPDGEDEDGDIWGAQRHSIDRLVKLIHMTTFHECPQSPISEIDVVDQNWCYYFIDQYVIDFIAAVFEERRIDEDTRVLKVFLQLDSEDNLSFREVLRLWLRSIGKKSNIYSLFEELKVLLAEFGREDLMYQMKAQFDMYKNEVYSEQSKQPIQSSHPQAKPLTITIPKNS